MKFWNLASSITALILSVNKKTRQSIDISLIFEGSMPFKFFYRFVISLIGITLLAACSGGDGDNGSETAPFTLSTNTLTFSTPSTSSTPASQDISATITGVDSGTLYIKAVSTGPAVASIGNITITGANTGKATVYPAQANTLGPGIFTSTITVTACTSGPNCTSELIGSPQTVDVTYTITGIVASVSTLDYFIGNVISPSNLEKQFNLTAYPNQDFTVDTNVPWLSADPTSGNTLNINQFTTTLDQVEIDNIANGEFTGSLAITFSSGEIISIPVTLTIARTQVNQVAPYVALENTVDDIIIRGENFTTVTIEDVLFGGVSASAFNVVSDTEIHATHPTLATGSYPVTVKNNLNVDRSFASLEVVASQSFNAGTLLYPGAPQQTLALEFDAQRNVLLVAASYFDGMNFNTASRMNNQILRYQFSAGSFSVLTMKTIPLLQDMSLSTNGKELIVITDRDVLHLDPVTLEETRRSSPTSLYTSTYLKDIVQMNDGTALITTGYVGSGSTNPVTYKLSTSTLDESYRSSRCFYYATPAVSANGALAILIQGGLSPTPSVCSFQASNGEFGTIPINANQTQCMNSAMGKCRPPALDRAASHIAVLDNSYTVRIYNQSYNLLGQLPDTHGAVIFNPDGTRAYSYLSNSLLRTFDLTASTVNGEFPELGSGTTLAGDPGVATNVYPSNPKQIVKMLVSPDGQTVFLAGSDRIVIQPVP